MNIDDSNLVMYRLAAEKDASERDSREKETKLLNLTRQLEELRDRLTESERLRTQQQRELDDLTSSQDDAGKNVCFSAIFIILVNCISSTL